jgi:hypothetical protein
MCGIYGWSFKKKARIPAAKREALSSVLAVANSLRGDQSWGYATIKDESRVQVRKEVGDIAGAAGIAKLGHHDMLMAHTRFATHGKVTAANQHPFKVGNIILAHNGVVYNHDELNAKHNRKCEVDSLHFAHALHERLPFKDIEAYGTIEWINDAELSRIYFSRLANGSLSVYGIENDAGAVVGIVWSSDEEHIKSALGAARLDGFPYQALEAGVIHFVERGAFYYAKGAEKLEVTSPSYLTRTQRYAFRSSGGRAYGAGGYTSAWADELYSSDYYDSTTRGERWARQPYQNRASDAAAHAEVKQKLVELAPVGNGQYADSTGRIVDVEESELLEEMAAAEEREEAEWQRMLDEETESVAVKLAAAK